MTVNVKDFAYGAVGNGSTDDTAAFQAACDTGSPVVYVPPGTYLISSAITLTRDTAHVVGWGRSASKDNFFVDATASDKNWAAVGTGSNAASARWGADTAGNYTAQMHFYGGIIRKGTYPTAAELAVIKAWLASLSGVSL